MNVLFLHQFLRFQPITVKEVREIMLRLKNTLPVESDEVRIRIVKFNSNTIASIICRIVNQKTKLILLQTNYERSHYFNYQSFNCLNLVDFYKFLGVIFYRKVNGSIIFNILQKMFNSLGM